MGCSHHAVSATGSARQSLKDGPEERPVTGAVLTRSLLTFVAPTPERVHRSGAGPGSLIESAGATV